eukprot:gene23110-31427_t
MSMTKNLASPSDWNRHLLKKKTNSAVSVRRVNVDILTGKEAVSAYFDPSKSVDCDVNDSEWMGENLFIPAIIIKDDNGLVSMRLPSGEVYKMNTADVVRVTDNDDEGVDDILKLRDFSEMSLIHTLRVRYFRGAIYTFVGPILVSINPYKYIKGIYSEKTMARATNDLLAELDLSSSIEAYKYLSGSAASATIMNVSDRDEFLRTCACMTSIGIDVNEQRNVFSLLSGLLHLGNVMFDDDDADGQVGGVASESEKSLPTASRFLGMDEMELAKSVTGSR